MTNFPNILITGTPGTGKTTLSELVALATGFQHINCSELVKTKNLHDGHDETFDTYILNEDKFLDEMEELIEGGNKVVDFHSCELFPKRYFDLVVVLQTENSVLYNRLKKRNYNEKKITENLECEIFMVVKEEAYESYDHDIIVVLDSNNVEDMESNVEKIQNWVENRLKTIQ